MDALCAQPALFTDKAKQRRRPCQSLGVVGDCLTDLQNYSGKVRENLTALKLLGQEAEAVERMRQASRQTYELARVRYEGGITSYLEVIESQRTLLLAELDSARLLGLRQSSSVQLIKALGGGWDEREWLVSRSTGRGQSRGK